MWFSPNFWDGFHDKTAFDKEISHWLTCYYGYRAYESCKVCFENVPGDLSFPCVTQQKVNVILVLLFSMRHWSTSRNHQCRVIRNLLACESMRKNLYKMSMCHKTCRSWGSIYWACTAAWIRDPLIISKTPVKKWPARYQLTKFTSQPLLLSNLSIVDWWWTPLPMELLSTKWN